MYVFKVSSNHELGKQTYFVKNKSFNNAMQFLKIPNKIFLVLDLCYNMPTHKLFLFTHQFVVYSFSLCCFDFLLCVKFISLILMQILNRFPYQLL